jgi:tetratricopeptide (TPR) repeat protein
MDKQTIFILGDSTSMTVGCERHMYPFIMADRGCWPQATEFVNCSQPGFTSADASAFFFRHRKDFPALRAVVIHLGTCDATSWEVRRGRYSPVKQSILRLKEVAGIKKERTRLKNRLLPFEWNSAFDPAIEAPEKPTDYEYNLSRIVESCASSSAAVVLIRPKANPQFLSGTGKGNFAFYRYLGIRDTLSERLSIPDERFCEALRLHETGRLALAAEAYREILLHSGPLSTHPEFPLIVANNYALCVAEQGDFDEAEALLRLLLKERQARHEIIFYNLAQLHRMRGDAPKYIELLQESRDVDSSMYRIRTPYLEAIDRIGARFNGDMHVVDMAAFIEDELFVDHTHPLREGQERIAGHVIELLKQRGVTGECAAQIRNILYNPELALGNTTEFFTYFRTFAPFSAEEISTHREKLGKAVDESPETADRIREGLPAEIRTALDYHRTHPCFPELRMILPFGPRYPSDVGRFPEYFLIRHLVPYLRVFEADPDLKGRFSTKTGILRSAEELCAMLPAEVIPLVESGEPVVEPVLQTERLAAILQACRCSLISHLRRGNQVYERMKTTIAWYFRESLRFGSHSRISMRYERVLLEWVAEALAVASLIDKRVSAGRGKEIIDLIRILEEAVETHEHYSRRFTEGDHSQGLLEEYDKHLCSVADQMEDR